MNRTNDEILLQDDGRLHVARNIQILHAHMRWDALQRSPQSADFATYDLLAFFSK